MTDFSYYGIWTDGKDIFYSSSAGQFVLDKETSTWVAKTWSGFIPTTGEYIWSDGENTYYSTITSQYILGYIEK